MIEEKNALALRRIELVGKLNTPIPVEMRRQIESELSIIKAQIKELNITEAAQQKTAAAKRRAAGWAEAQANAARALERARAKVDSSSEMIDEEKLDESILIATVDSWIDSVLLRHDIDFTRAPDDRLMLTGSPKWKPVMEMLIEGFRAVAQGQELPELSDPKAVKPKKR